MTAIYLGSELEGKIVKLAIILIFILFFVSVEACLGSEVLKDSEKKLKEKIITIHKAGGEHALREFMKTRKVQISKDFIVSFAETGLKEKKEEWLKICEILAEEIKDDKILADVYMFMGRYYREKSNNQETRRLFGEDYFSKAFRIYDKAMFHYAIAGDYIGQGNTCRIKAEYYLRINSYEKAFKFLNKAQILYGKAGYSKGEGHIYIYKGDIYTKNGCYSKANALYDNALKIFEKKQDFFNIAEIYRKKGEIFLLDEEKSPANRMFEKALFFYDRVKETDKPATAYHHRGDIYFFNGKKSRALEMYEKALSLFKGKGDDIGQAGVYCSKGDVFFCSENYSGALDMYDKALVIYDRRVGHLDSKSYALHKKAGILAKLGKKIDASSCYEEAVSLLQVLHYRSPIYNMKRAFQKKTYHRFEEAVTFMLENELYKQAFDCIEFIKTRFFNDRKTEVLGSIDKNLSPTLKKKRDELVEKLSQFSKEIYKLSSGEGNKKLKELKAHQRTVENEFEELVLDIRLIYSGLELKPEWRKMVDKNEEDINRLSEYYYKTHGIEDKKKLRESKKSSRKSAYKIGDMYERFVSTIYRQSIYDARNPLAVTVGHVMGGLKEGEILLNYFILSDKVYVFLVSTRNFTVVPLEVKPKKLQAYVERFSMAAKKEKGMSGGIEFYGKILYNELFKPVEAELRGSKDIIINPDSILAKIPFEALITSEEESGRQVFLLEKYRMKYIQAASLLTHRRRVEPGNGEIKSFIGFGDPVYDYENLKKNKTGGETDSASSSKGNEMMELYRILYNRAGGSMNRLAGSGEEVKTIARLFQEKGKKSMVHLREDANEANVKAPGMKNFDIIHLACHGIMGGNFQSLLLAQGSSGAREDGYFTLNEIMNCNYSANLIVLSSCLTASGKVESGESVTGLAAAFMYAGTPAVVASLWKVDDTAARELMVNFYANLLEKNMDKSEALRQAKLKLLKNKKYSSPFSWSAFVLYGE